MNTNSNTNTIRSAATTRTMLVLGTALAAALALGGCAAGDSGGAGASPSASAPAGHGEGHGADQSTGQGTAQSAGEASEADIMFAQMMIPHHQQAVQMSEILLAKEGLDPEVATLARQIKAAQGPEIETMTGWLEDWGVDPDAVDHGSMDHGGMDGMLSSQELEALEQADTEEATRLYLEGMIEHHEGAVKMAEDEVANGQYPEAVALAESIIETQNAEIQQMRDMLEAGPTAAGAAGASGHPESGAPVAGDQAMLADHGLDGLDARQVIEKLDAQAVADRPADLVASVQPEQLLVADDQGRQTALPMPKDEVYLSAAPYVSQTHDCHFHSLTTCLGELQNEDVHVKVVDQASGEVLLDEDRRTFDNGFVGMWLPRGIEAELTIEHEDGTATTTVSTKANDDATCLTGLQLTDA